MNEQREAPQATEPGNDELSRERRPRDRDIEPISDDEPRRRAKPELKEPQDPLWAGSETTHMRQIGLGLLVMTALHGMFVYLLFPLFPAGAVGLKIGLGVLPYLIGGALLGFLARERESSLLDPFYASLIPASTFTFLVEVHYVLTSHPPNMGEVMARMRWLAVLAPLLAYVLLSLLGSWFGEKARGGLNSDEPLSSG